MRGRAGERGARGGIQHHRIRKVIAASRSRGVLWSLPPSTTGSPDARCDAEGRHRSRTRFVPAFLAGLSWALSGEGQRCRSLATRSTATGEETEASGPHARREGSPWIGPPGGIGPAALTLPKSTGKEDRQAGGVYWPLRQRQTRRANRARLPCSAAMPSLVKNRPGRSRTRASRSIPCRHQSLTILLIE